MTDTRLIQLRRFAYWLDDGFRVPGTRVRIGLDPIIGLVPGLGDVTGAILSFWIVVAGIRRGASRATLMRMAFNIAIDALIGAIPLLGDIFDVAWKANLRNVKLLERHLAEPRRASQADRLFVIFLTATALGVCAAVMAGGAFFTWWIIHLVFRR
jgi:hypothetical protein